MPTIQEEWDIFRKDYIAMDNHIEKVVRETAQLFQSHAQEFDFESLIQEAKFNVYTKKLLQIILDRGNEELQYKFTTFLFPIIRNTTISFFSEELVKHHGWIENPKWKALQALGDTKKDLEDKGIPRFFKFKPEQDLYIMPQGKNEEDETEGVHIAQNLTPEQIIEGKSLKNFIELCIKQCVQAHINKRNKLTEDTKQLMKFYIDIMCKEIPQKDIANTCKVSEPTVSKIITSITCCIKKKIKKTDLPEIYYLRGK